MGDDNLKEAAKMLLQGATLLAEPCPYCSGVRVLKSGRALCISCGSAPQERRVEAPPRPDSERRMLELTRQLGSATSPALRAALLDSISKLSKEMARETG